MFSCLIKLLIRAMFSCLVKLLIRAMFSYLVKRVSSRRIHSSDNHKIRVRQTPSHLPGADFHSNQGPNPYPHNIFLASTGSASQSGAVQPASNQHTSHPFRNNVFLNSGSSQSKPDAPHPYPKNIFLNGGIAGTAAAGPTQQFGGNVFFTGKHSQHTNRHSDTTYRAVAFPLHDRCSVKITLAQFNHSIRYQL